MIVQEQPRHSPERAGHASVCPFYRGHVHTQRSDFLPLPAEGQC